MTFKRVHNVVLDSLGIGEAPDAAKFDDAGMDTFGNIAKVCGKLNIPIRRSWESIISGF